MIRFLDLWGYRWYKLYKWLLIDEYSNDKWYIYTSLRLTSSLKPVSRCFRILYVRFQGIIGRLESSW
jgi:hypothetical protein